MAWLHYIDKTVNSVFLKCTGSTRPGEFLEYLELITNDSDYIEGLCVLCDFRNTRVPDEVNHGYLLKVKDQCLKIDNNTKYSRIAHVYGNDTDFGKGRQMVSLFADLPTPRSVFRDIDEAREWLDIPPDYDINFD